MNEKTCVSCGSRWSVPVAACPFCGGQARERGRVESKASAPAQAAGPRPQNGNGPGPESPARAPAPALREASSAPRPAPAPRGNDLALRRPDEAAAPAPSPAFDALRVEAPDRPFGPPPPPGGATHPLYRALEESGSHLVYVGALAVAGVVLLPLTLLFQSGRVIGILGFVATSFFIPFAPIAWFAGQNHELRLRARGLEPHPAVGRAKRLGILATSLLAGELVLIGLLIAVLRLSGRMPGSFGLLG